MHEGVASIHAQQSEIGYPSVFIEGAADCMTYMSGIFDDWQAKGITSVLHEKRGGYANNVASMDGLSRKGQGRGRAHLEGVRVRLELRLTRRGGDRGGDRPGRSCGPRGGRRRPVGPRAVGHARPPDGDHRRDQGVRHHDVKMWRYLALQEGTLGVDPTLLQDQRRPHAARDPRRHRRAAARRSRRRADHRPALGHSITSRTSCSTASRAAPCRIMSSHDDVRSTPMAPQAPSSSLRRNSPHVTSALAFCQKRFEGKSPLYHDEQSGGIGCFTPDSFPVFDVFRENCYVIADSNHGYKMLGVGQLVAKEVLARRARCSPRSATAATPKASCIRSRPAPSPGAEPRRGPAKSLL